MVFTTTCPYCQMPTLETGFALADGYAPDVISVDGRRWSKTTRMNVTTIRDGWRF